MNREDLNRFIVEIISISDKIKKIRKEASAQEKSFFKKNGIEKKDIKVIKKLANAYWKNKLGDLKEEIEVFQEFLIKLNKI